MRYDEHRNRLSLRKSEARLEPFGNAAIQREENDQ